MDIHDYQIKMFAVLSCGGILYWSTFELLKLIGADGMYAARWLVVLAALAWILWILLYYREKIFAREKRRVTGWTFVLWAILGITIIKWHTGTGAEFSPGDLIFLVYTVLLADSYWDFKELKRGKNTLNQN